MQCECDCKYKSKHEENMMTMMDMELSHQTPKIESHQNDQNTAASSNKTKDIVIKDSKTAPTLSTNAIRDCNNESVIVLEN